MVITADHGNCEQMFEPSINEPHTRHTMNPVELIVYGKGLEGLKLRSGGKLYSGSGLSTDIIGASIRAYVSALNKIIYEEV